MIIWQKKLELTKKNCLEWEVGGSESNLGQMRRILMLIGGFLFEK